MKQHDLEETRFCPFKRAITRDYNGKTGRTEMRERFEVCAGERCMAYDNTHVTPRCRRLEAPRNG